MMASSRLNTLSQHIQSPSDICCRPCGVAHVEDSTTTDLEPPMSVFVLIGQSNMAGRGVLGETGDSTDATSTGVFCFGYDDDSWHPASQPLHLDPPIVASMGGNEPKGAGLGWAFARKLLDEKLVDGTIGLVPCAFGGSPLSRWVREPHGGVEAKLDDADASAALPVDAYEGRAQELPPNPGTPGDLYARAWRRTKLALSTHPNAVLRGFLWHQGESDAASYELASTVSSRLTEMIANFRDDLTAECVPFPYARRREFEVPFVLGELGHFLITSAARPCVNVVQEQLGKAAEDAPDCALVSATGLTHLGDDVHFDTPSLYEFGRRYADAWAKLDLAGSWRFQVAPVPPAVGTGRAFAAVTASAAATAAWQSTARAELARLLLGKSASYSPHGGDAEVLEQECTQSGTLLTKLSFTSSAGPGATAWLAVPPTATPTSPSAGVLVLPGHGGTAEQVATPLKTNSCITASSRLIF